MIAHTTTLVTYPSSFTIKTGATLDSKSNNQNPTSIPSSHISRILLPCDPYTSLSNEETRAANHISKIAPYMTTKAILLHSGVLRAHVGSLPDEEPGAGIVMNSAGGISVSDWTLFLTVWSI